MLYEVITRSHGGGGGGRGNFALEPHQMERLRQEFQEALETELAGSPSFTLVTEPSPEALRITGHIVDLVVNTPPEHGRDKVYVAVSGEMTMILDVADSQSLEPLRITSYNVCYTKLLRCCIARWPEADNPPPRRGHRHRHC